MAYRTIKLKRPGVRGALNMVVLLTIVIISSGTFANCIGKIGR